MLQVFFIWNAELKAFSFQKHFSKPFIIQDMKQKFKWLKHVEVLRP